MHEVVRFQYCSAENRFYLDGSLGEPKFKLKLLFDFDEILVHFRKRMRKKRFKQTGNPHATNVQPTCNPCATQNLAKFFVNNSDYNINFRKRMRMTADDVIADGVTADGVMADQNVDQNVNIDK